MPRNILCLFSGGYDSSFLCLHAREQGVLTCALFLDYGQASAQQEELAARSFCAAHSIPLHQLALPLLDVGAMNAPSGEAGERVVPGRNLLFVAVAVTHALSVGADEVWLGATAEDRHGYPDCRMGFVSGVNNAARAYGVGVAAPLVRRTRRDMVEYAARAGWDLSGAWSCYAPTDDGDACGTCNSCRQ